MLADIEDGIVGCVIVKDMSRIGRNYLEVGFYTEVLFRKKNVRFIAISNNEDSSLNDGSNEFAPFLNIMNEWYVRDTSRKIKSVLHNKGMDGKHLTSNAIYGYKKDPDDHDRWIIDEEAASNYVKEHETEFIEKVRSATELQQESEAKALKKRLSREQKRINELNTLIKKIYEDNVDKFIELVHRYTDFTELTTPMIHEFVDKIVVHEADKSTGDRIQQIDIYLKYVGRLDVPMP